MKIKRHGDNVVELICPHWNILFSYETPVAAWVEGEGYIRTEVHYSRTTSRHINQWLSGLRAAQVITCPQERINLLCGIRS